MRGPEHRVKAGQLNASYTVPYKTAPAAFLVIYFLFVNTILLADGVNNSVALLMLGGFIFLTTVIVDRRYITIATALSIASLSLAYSLHRHGVYVPKKWASGIPEKESDVIVYSCMLFVFGIVAWFVSNKIHKNLSRAKSAEARLKKQKLHLAEKLEEERRRLKQAQMEEIQQLHHFAQVGQSTIAMLHEMSNHLSVLTLDIESLTNDSSHNSTIQNTRQSIRYINSMIRLARKKINSKQRYEVFDVLPVILNTIKYSRSKIESSGLAFKKTISLNDRCYLAGDSTSLSHAISILIKNSYEACLGIEDGEILFSAIIQHETLIIKVSDNGPGIPNEVKLRLFQPQNSKKDNGLGIGLYIARQIIQTQFKGRLELDDTKNTCFSIQIPVSATSKPTLAANQLKP